ncbi:MAG: GIY-YIG nuclease family protein [Thermovirgaceae bacterium]
MLDEKGKDPVLGELLDVKNLVAAADIYERKRVIPDQRGVYAWFFEPHKLGIRSGHYEHLLDGKALLYVGVVPSTWYSKRTLPRRIRTHIRGTARQSTLRYSLGACLIEELALDVNHLPGFKLNFGDFENRLTKWICENGYVTWSVHEEPWKVERDFVALLKPALNLKHNEKHPFHAILKRRRKKLRQGE